MRCSSNNNLKVSGEELSPPQFAEELVFLYSHVPDKEVGETASPNSEVLYITKSWN